MGPVKCTHRNPSRPQGRKSRCHPLSIQQARRSPARAKNQDQLPRRLDSERRRTHIRLLLRLDLAQLVRSPFLGNVRLFDEVSFLTRSRSGSEGSAPRLSSPLHRHGSCSSRPLARRDIRERDPPACQLATHSPRATRTDLVITEEWRLDELIQPRVEVIVDLLRRLKVAARVLDEPRRLVRVSGSGREGGS